MFLIGGVQSQPASEAKNGEPSQSGIVPVFHSNSFHIHIFRLTNGTAWCTRRREGRSGVNKRKGIRIDFPFFMECNFMMRTFYVPPHLSPGSTLPADYHSRSILTFFAVHCREHSSTRTILRHNPPFQGKLLPFSFVAIHPATRLFLAT